MSNHAIASVLSFVTACFTMAASWIPNKRKSFFCMVAQCLIYSVASFFFGVYSTIPVMILCAARNWLSAKERFTMKICIPFCVVTVILGLLFNNAGMIGLLPIVATVQFNVCSVLFQSLLQSKRNIFINLAMWVVYDVLIQDYPSLTLDVTASALAIAAIIRIHREKLN